MFVLGIIVINYLCFFGIICGSYCDIFFFVFLVKFVVIDIVFVFSVMGMLVNIIFKLMKDIIDFIVEKYGMGSM